MSKIRIGFIGVGNMGQMAHLKNYVHVDDCEVVALAEGREQTGKLVAERYGIPKVYADYKEMLAAEKLDGVVASQSFPLHAAFLPTVYKKVKCVFTEKPLCLSVDAGRKLAAAAKRTGCTHMVGYHKRSDPATMYAKDVIDGWKKSGKNGPMQYVRLLMPAGDWIAGGFTGLLNAGDKLEGGFEWEPPVKDMDAKTGQQYLSFVNYYIHQVNLMRHLLGEPYKVTYAEKSGVLLAVQSKSGIAGTIEMSPYSTTIAWEESALVAFANGYVKLNLPAPLTSFRAGTVETYEDPGQGATPMRTSPTLPWVHAMRQQAINFVKVCQGKAKPLCDAAEALEDLKMARQYIKLRYGK